MMLDKFIQLAYMCGAYTESRSTPLMMAQTHGELLEQTVSPQPGLDSLMVKFRALNSDDSPGVKYVRVLTVKQRIYKLYFIPKDKSGKAVRMAQRVQFFNAVVRAQSN